MRIWNIIEINNNKALNSWVITAEPKSWLSNFRKRIVILYNKIKKWPFLSKNLMKRSWICRILSNYIKQPDPRRRIREWIWYINWIRQTNITPLRYKTSPSRSWRLNKSLNRWFRHYTIKIESLSLTNRL